MVLTVSFAALTVDQFVSKPTFTKFEPTTAGAIEASMWRSYYDGRWPELALQTVSYARSQYGFSAWDSTRLAWHAARAAYFFRHDGADPRSLTELKSYYRIIRRATSEKWSESEAAELELRWWRERREAISPEDYAKTVARLTELIHGLPENAALPASLLRVQAMTYRDLRRNGRMRDTDWSHVAALLGSAYAQWKETLQPDER